jgi:hypothetical protein
VGSCGEVNPAILRVVSIIKNSGGRLLNLINDILDAAAMRQVRASRAGFEAIVKWALWSALAWARKWAHTLCFFLWINRSQRSWNVPSLKLRLRLWLRRVT